MRRGWTNRETGGVEGEGEEGEAGKLFTRSAHEYISHHDPCRTFYLLCSAFCPALCPPVFLPFPLSYHLSFSLFPPPCLASYVLCSPLCPLPFHLPVCLPPSTGSALCPSSCLIVCSPSLTLSASASSLLNTLLPAPLPYPAHPSFLNDRGASNFTTH